MNLAVEFARRGVEVRRSSFDEDEIRLCCVFCTSMGTSVDTRFRLGINLSTGKGHCFNCGWSSQSKALILLLRNLGVEAHDVDANIGDFGAAEEKPKKKIKLPEGFEKLEYVDENDPLFGQARRYVKKRGITLRQLHEHEVGATVADDFFRYRIVFPVRFRGKLVGLVGRDWTGRNPKKYLNSSGGRTVYNYAPEKYGGKKLGIVSEGITKALAIERALNYKICSTALLGNQITDVQANLLKEFEEVCLFPDPDRDGMTGFLGVAANLQSLMKTVSMAWPWSTEQADDMRPEDIKEAIKNRRVVAPLLHLRIQSLMKERESE